MDVTLLSRRCAAVALAAALFFSAVPTSTSETGPDNHRQKPICAFEFLTFRSSDEHKTFLEVFAQVPTHNLQFIKGQNGFFASYQLTVELESPEGDVIESETFVDSVKVGTFWDIEQPRPPKLVRFAFLVPPGSYKARMQIKDLETLRAISFTRRLDVPNYYVDTLAVSDLQIAVQIASTERRNVLVKNSKLILPNIPRIVGNGISELHVYAEIYNLSQGTEGRNEFVATYEIRDLEENVVDSYTLKDVKPGDKSFITVQIPVEELNSGQYELELRVEDLDTGAIASRSTNFLVLRPGLDAKFYSDLVVRAHGEAAAF